MRTLAAFAFAAAIAGLVAIAMSSPKPTSRELRHALLRELQPVTLANCTLERIGSANDGGYLMCGNLLGGGQAAYSYGIGPADDWGCDVSRRLGVIVHQYDCFNPPESACPNSQSMFHNECVGPRAELKDGRVFDSLTHQIAKNGDAGRILIAKIDIEGAELDSLLTTSDGVLATIDQLAMEIHGTDRRFLDLVRKLKRTFYPVHIHFNNQACTSRFKPFPAWAYQVLFVNQRIGVLDRVQRAPVLPHPLDAPDYSLGKDCQTPWPIAP
ncbi:MAG TPA: hypothetical protein VFJ02_21725 [Vicinamibacterales bacterium]|nr:hypothetical protein [Vicinamibacterales bacterium]